MKDSSYFFGNKFIRMFGNKGFFDGQNLLKKKTKCSSQNNFIAWSRFFRKKESQILRNPLDAY